MYSTGKSKLNQVDERHQWPNRTNVAVTQENDTVANGCITGQPEFILPAAAR